MINTLQPGNKPGHDDIKGEVLKRIHEQYGHPEKKQREAVKKLGKDEFFNIMVQQIQYQDPLKPYQNEEMAAQMAQFTALEQMMNVNKNLEKLAQSQTPMHQLTAASLIGKAVTVDSSKFSHSEGKYSDLHFNLPQDASRVRITVLSERGEAVNELQFTDLKQGPNQIPWNGKKSNGLPSPTGSYFFQIFAEDHSGKPLQIQTQNTEVVHGVSFEGNEVVLLVGDKKSPKKFLFSNVSKIVDLNEQQKITEKSQAKESEGPIPDVNPAAKKFLGLKDNEEEVKKSPSQSLEGQRVPGYEPGLAAKYAPIEAESFLGNAIAGKAGSAGKQTLPSSEDGSTAGRWKE